MRGIKEPRAAIVLQEIFDSALFYIHSVYFQVICSPDKIGSSIRPKGFNVPTYGYKPSQGVNK